MLTGTYRWACRPSISNALGVPQYKSCKYLPYLYPVNHSAAGMFAGMCRVWSSNLKCAYDQTTTLWELARSKPLEEERGKTFPKSSGINDIQESKT